MSVLIALILLIGIITGGYLLNGWALFKLWGWFIVPFGLPPLSIPWAIGVAIVVGFLTTHSIPKGQKEDDISLALVVMFVRPLISVFIGWIVYSFMR